MNRDIIDRELEIYEEAYELIDHGEEGKPQLSVIDMEQVENNLRILRYWTDEIERRKAHAAQEMLRIKNYVAQAESRLAWHRAGLEWYLRQEKKKKVKGIYGSFSMVDGREKAVVENPKAFSTWTHLNDRRELVEVTEKADTKAILKFVQENEGELPDGIGIETGDPYLTVRLEK